jgi:AraC family transcriptional activator FtrA
VLQERVAQACNLLEASRMYIEQVATATGFGSADTLRTHSRTRLDTSPAQYRLSFRA